MWNTNSNRTMVLISASLFLSFFFTFSLLPALWFLSLSLQQMALVRGGQVTDNPAPPPRTLVPCPASPVPSLSCPLSCQQPLHPASSAFVAARLLLIPLSSQPVYAGRTLPFPLPQRCKPSGLSRWLERTRRRSPLTWELSQTWPTVNGWCLSNRPGLGLQEFAWLLCLCAVPQNVVSSRFYT